MAAKMIPKSILKLELYDWFLGSHMIPKMSETSPFEYRTLQLSGMQMNPVFGCPVFRWLLG